MYGLYLILILSLKRETGEKPADTIIAVTTTTTTTIPKIQITTTTAANCQFQMQ